METQRFYGQDCYQLTNGETAVAVTRSGAHLGPVTFFADAGRPVRPYYISPWQDEGLDIADPVLRMLRGDFFCMPFGPSDGTTDAAQPAHGEAATADWEALDCTRSGQTTTLRLRLETALRPGWIACDHTLVDGHACLYTRHTIGGNAGAVTLGHHATLTAANGPLAIRSAPIRFGITSPRDYPWMRDGEYGALAPAARFDSLERVPTIWKEPAFTDCSVFPAREGFVDILQVVQEPSNTPGWITALCRAGGYLWFALKRTDLLPSTVIWMENRGRHVAPWSGRNTCIGLEDVCSYVALGLKASRDPNPVNAEGIPTVMPLDGSPVTIPYIQGVVRTPPDFDALEAVAFEPDGVVFTAYSGARARTPVHIGFLNGDTL